MSSTKGGKSTGHNNMTTITAESDTDPSRIFNYTERDWIVFDGSLSSNSQHMISVSWIERLLPLVEGSFSESVSFCV